MSLELQQDVITFGKYKNNTLDCILKDRSYCTWLLKQDWFRNNYEYLYNRVQEYEPLTYFLKKPEDTGDFVDRYQFFNLKCVNDIEIKLTEEDKNCYNYYLKMVDELKKKIQDKVNKNEDNVYDIKAPCKWLKRFEDETGLKRDDFKIFITSYELPNIPYIVERIKKEGGIEYKGAQSFNIAKKRSLDQESYWEGILKKKYGEDLGAQFKYNNCIFDFINISTNTVFECKLGLKDFDLSQYKKYRIALEKFRIVYIIGKDAVINMEENVIYTVDDEKYISYQVGIISGKYTGLFNEEIKQYMIVHVDDLSLCV